MCIKKDHTKIKRYKFLKNEIKHRPEKKIQKLLTNNREKFTNITKRLNIRNNKKQEEKR